MTVCAIHQPNFFPWLGYFDKIAKADIFVFLDAVAYPKSGSGSGSWVNRVRIPLQNKPHWIGCPIRREHGTQLIKDVLIDDQQAWRKKCYRTLEQNYAKAPYFSENIDKLHTLIFHEQTKLADFNMHAIKNIAAQLGLQTKFVVQSNLPVTGSSTELLINICKSVGASTYLCGGGSGEYLDESLFAKSGIELRYQEYKPVIYGDAHRFISGMSIIDSLMYQSAENI